MKRRTWFLLTVAAAVAVPAAPASAHPLGNFTINTYTGFRVGTEKISVDFLVDMAEIPTLQRKRDAERPGYARQECERQVGQLDVRLDERRLDLRLDRSDVAFPDGQGGLSTLRLTCGLSAPIASLRGDQSVSFSSSSFTDRIGWREITAVGDGTTLVTSNVPERSISNRLTSYPEDLLASPVDQRTAELVVRPGGAASAVADSPERTGPLPGSVDRVTRAFTSFVTRHDLTVSFGLLAVLASVVLGGIHAFAPGHGKTVMAAYLVGQRGSLRQAMLIAVTVTATHTLGVLVLGVVISTSTTGAPERLYPWLGAASGVIVALVGLGVLVRMRRAARHRRDHHHHQHEHVHSHGGRRHSHGPIAGTQLVTWRSLLAMGFAGGLLPSPSAVVVLLGAVALGRAWFGVLLVLMFGIGMAATLMGMGLLILRARGALEHRVSAVRNNRLLLATSRMLPGVTAAFIVVVGLYLTARGAAQIA